MLARLSTPTSKRSQGPKAARVMGAEEDEGPHLSTPSRSPTPPLPMHHSAPPAPDAAAQGSGASGSAQVLQAQEGAGAEGGQGAGWASCTETPLRSDVHSTRSSKESVRDLVRLLSTDKGLRKAEGSGPAMRGGVGGSEEGGAGGWAAGRQTVGHRQKSDGKEGLGKEGNEKEGEDEEDKEDAPSPSFARPLVPHLPLHRVRRGSEEQRQEGAHAAGTHTLFAAATCPAAASAAADASSCVYPGSAGSPCSQDESYLAAAAGGSYPDPAVSAGATPAAGAAEETPRSAAVTPIHHRPSQSSPTSVYSKLYHNAAAAPDSPHSGSQFPLSPPPDAHAPGSRSALRPLPPPWQAAAAAATAASTPEAAVRPTKLQLQLERLRAEMQQRQDASNVSDSM